MQLSLHEERKHEGREEKQRKRSWKNSIRVKELVVMEGVHEVGITHKLGPRRQATGPNNYRNDSAGGMA